MTGANSKLLELAHQLDDLCKKRSTGELILTNANGEGKLHLLSGRLLFATDGFHPVRRWKRNIRQFCPKWQPDFSKIENNLLWEYELLHQGVRDKTLQVNEAKTVIRAIAKEVFFNIACGNQWQFHWQSESSSETELSLSLSLSYLEVEPTLIKTAKMHREWCTAGLSKLSPILAPILIKPLDPKTIFGMGKYLKGQLTLWDLALGMNQSVHQITCQLIPLVKKRLIQFKVICDLPLPFEHKKQIEVKLKTQIETISQEPIIKAPVSKGLIACVDDSPLIFEVLRNIIEPNGYELLCIQEPMRGFGQLIERKPDLIFLDLIMPTANGYSVCKFLRKTTIFEKTPIIILSSRDTLIDRNRAKLVGASDFLGKPPDQDKTLAILDKYLSVVKNKIIVNPMTNKTEEINLAF